jgi:mannose-6-phosphate isomerase-like protein (cupin superfamily)
VEPGQPTKGFHTPSGKDRFKEDDLMIWGAIPLSTKLSSKDTGGAIYLFEHADMGKGGPPRHIHHAQDEWFYVIKGEFLFEVGDERFQLHPGDSLFAPRKIPHAWAHIGDEPGTLLTAVSPAGTFETFIRETANLSEIPAPEEMAQTFEAHGMTIVGPPLLAGG